MTATERRRAQAIALARFRRLACFRSARHVATYHAVGAELDPAGLEPAHGKAFYLPVLHGKQLRFATHEGRHLALNSVGIPEPIDSPRLLPGALDVVVVPLTGFDAAGNRLGTGGGFYDRSFGYRRMRPRTGPWLVGLGFECQRVPELTADWWDVPLDRVVTEAGVYHPAIDQHLSRRTGDR